MRTTLTLDDDVTAILRRIETERNLSRKEVVNAALRKGLLDMEQPPKPCEPFRTKTFQTGKCALPNLDCVSEVLDWLDSQDSQGDPK
jgi:hypothetical protein